MPVFGFIVCLFVWLLVLNLHQIGKIVGTAWFIVGVIMYLAYRRSQKLDWKKPIPGDTGETHPEVAHNLHPEIAETLKAEKGYIIEIEVSMRLDNMSNRKKSDIAPAGLGKVGFSVMALDMMLSIAILALGVYMMALLVFNGNWIMLLPSLLFMGIGVLKIKKILPILSTSMNKGKEAEMTTHKNVVVPISRPETIESLVNIACDLLAEGGTLRLLNIIEVPQQLPYEYADTKKPRPVNCWCWLRNIAKSGASRPSSRSSRPGIRPKRSWTCQSAISGT